MMAEMFPYVYVICCSLYYHRMAIIVAVFRLFIESGLPLCGVTQWWTDTVYDKKVQEQTCHLIRCDMRVSQKERGCLVRDLHRVQPGCDA